MSSPNRQGRMVWLLGTVAVLALSAFIGTILGNVWLGLILGVVVSLGWLLAYESRRGGNQGVYDDDNEDGQL